MARAVAVRDYQLAVRPSWDDATKSLRADVVAHCNGKVCGRVVLTIDLRAVWEEAARILRERLHPVDSVGGLWGSIKGAARKVGKAANRVAARTGLKKVAQLATKLSPKLLGIYPPLGIPIAQVKRAAKLLTAARRGNPSAKAKVATIAAAAKSGDPGAQDAITALQRLNTAATKGHDVEQWSEDLQRQASQPVQLEAGVTAQPMPDPTAEDGGAYDDDDQGGYDAGDEGDGAEMGTDQLMRRHMRW